MGFASYLDDIVDSQLERGAESLATGWTPTPQDWPGTTAEWIAHGPSLRIRRHRAESHLNEIEREWQSSLASFVKCRHERAKDSLELKKARSDYVKSCVAIGDAALEFYKVALEYNQANGK